jgi:hypothetical protein
MNSTIMTTFYLYIEQFTVDVLIVVVATIFLLNSYSFLPLLNQVQEP